MKLVPCSSYCFSHYLSCLPGVKKLIKNGSAFKSLNLAYSSIPVRTSTKSPEHEVITFIRCALRFVSNIECCFVLSIHVPYEYCLVLSIHVPYEYCLVLSIHVPYEYCFVLSIHVPYEYCFVLSIHVPYEYCFVLSIHVPYEYCFVLSIHVPYEYCFVLSIHVPYEFWFLYPIFDSTWSNNAYKNTNWKHSYFRLFVNCIINYVQVKHYCAWVREHRECA